VIASLRRRLANEEGFAVLAALFVTTIIIAFLAAVVLASVTSVTHGVRDVRVKRALQAADAGIQAGLYALNENDLKNTDFNGGLSQLINTLNCIPLKYNAQGQIQAGSAIALTWSAASGQCVPTHNGTAPPGPPAFTDPERIGSHAYFQTATVMDTSSSGSRKVLQPIIVSQGVDDGGSGSGSTPVIRRVEAILRPIDPFQLIEAQGNLTWEGLFTVNGDARTGGTWSQGATLVGNAVTGVNLLSGGHIVNTADFEYGTSYTPNGGLTIPAAKGPNGASYFSRPVISVSHSKPDCPGGLSTNCPTGYQQSTDTFSLSSGTAVFQPGDYVFCSFNANGGATIEANPTAVNQPVRIFIDPSRSNCPSGSGNFTSDVAIQNLLTTGPSNLQIYLVGNGTPGGTHVAIDPPVVPSLLPQEFFLYAPKSDVAINFNIFQGAIIGNNVTLQGGICVLQVLGSCVTRTPSVMTQDLNINNLPLAAGLGAFTVKQYIECQPEQLATADSPTKDC
jgi:hypothetical protein